MDLQSQLLFFFSALGAFNGVLMGLFFLFHVRPKHKSHLFLGLLLLALSVRVGKSVFFFFNYDLADIYIQIGLFACWFIGPFLYFYVKSALMVSKDLAKETRLHFAILIPVALALFLLFPRSNYEKLWISWFFDFIYLQWIAYVVITGFLIRKNFHKISKAQGVLPSFKFWFLSVYIGNAIICIAFNTASYTSYIVGALSFSFVFYLLIVLLLFAKKRNQLLFLVPPRNREKRIDGEKAAHLITKLERLMEEEELYKDANLTMPKVSERLKILPNKLSLLLNDNMNVSFADYVNEKRITSAQRLIKQHSSHSFESIGYDCGFNSKSAFYVAFKKHTGTTPAKYRNSQSEVNL
ncbi:helix-turn-helix domain-containing protein [Flagellimonas sp. 2504JD1-5]